MFKLYFALFIVFNILLNNCIAIGEQNAEDCKSQFPVFEKDMHKKAAYCETMRGGRSLGNKIYLIRDENGIDYAVRLLQSAANNSTSEQRDMEIKAFKISSDLGVAPKLYYYNTAEGIIISKYIKTKSYFDKNHKFSQNFIKSFAEKMKLMHNGDKFAFRDKVIDRILEKRLGQIKGSISNDDYKFIEKTLQSVKDKYLFSEDDASSHRDMVHNILYDVNDEVFLIDFESSSYDNKYYDIVTALLFFCNDKKDQEKFLNIYFNRKPTEVEYAKIETMKPVVLLYTAIRLYINYLKHNKTEQDIAKKSAKVFSFEEMLLDRRKNGNFRISTAVDLYEGFYGLLNETKKHVKSEKYRKSEQILEKYKIAS